MNPKLIYRSSIRRGFSLVEVLLAMFILGIGLIMVATVFPVGADWTRQGVEDNVAQTVAQNALTVIQNHYGPGGDHAPGNGVNLCLRDIATYTTPDNITLAPLPDFATIPLNERAYQYGNITPFPAPNPTACTYFWTALCRLNPKHINNSSGNVNPAATYTYDIYICVFHKGDASQQYTAPSFASNYYGYSEMTAPTSMSPTPTINTAPRRPTGEDFVPTFLIAGSGYSDGTNLPGIGPIPKVGSIGIGAFSGTVYRQGFDSFAATPKAVARPPISTGGSNPDTNANGIIFSPGDNNAGKNAASPLVYVFQTSLTY